MSYLNVGIGLWGHKLDSNGEEIRLHSGDGELHHSCAVGGINDRQAPFQDMLLGIKLVFPGNFADHRCSYPTPAGVGEGGG